MFVGLETLPVPQHSPRSGKLIPHPNVHVRGSQQDLAALPSAPAHLEELVQVLLQVLGQTKGTRSRQHLHCLADSHIQPCGKTAESCFPQPLFSPADGPLAELRDGSLPERRRAGATVGDQLNTKIKKINTGTVRKLQRELHPPVERLRAKGGGIEELLGGMPIAGCAETEPRRVGGSARPKGFVCARIVGADAPRRHVVGAGVKASPKNDTGRPD